MNRPPLVLSVAEKPSVAKRLAEIISSNPSPSKKAGSSKYNPIWELDNVVFRNQPANMKVTSVSGHLMGIEFTSEYGWDRCNPNQLFDAPIERKVTEEGKDIEKTLLELAKKCKYLLLWLDCDMEGENISYEVIEVCQSANPHIEIFRARFSALIPRDIMRTLNNPGRPNKNLSDAVATRQEIDLRIGAAFTRFQTKRLQFKYSRGGPDRKVYSYGPCQFPTLGFVVDRYLKVQAFKPEDFWSLSCEYEGPDPDCPNNNSKKLTCKFSWDRQRVFDRLICTVYLETCVEEESGGVATVTKCNARPTTKRRPNPMNTIEMQKRASRLFGMGSETTMKIAEELYRKGILSYPRTETDFFKEGTELHQLIEEHRGHSVWGEYAASLLDNGKFLWPGTGGHDDQAHPPIHPTKRVDLNDLSSEEKQVYELVTIHFLACCSNDAKGNQTNISVEIPWGGESFSATGLMVLERNWLEVYSKYEKWTANRVPVFNIGDTFVAKRIQMTASRTEAPLPISESDLITEMDKSGIGTDATIATHISTIIKRDYSNKDNNNRFTPTLVGLALVEAYNTMGYQLNKPSLRAAMEIDMQKIARGERTKEARLLF